MFKAIELMWALSDESGRGDRLRKEGLISIKVGFVPLPRMELCSFCEQHNTFRHRLPEGVRHRRVRQGSQVKCTKLRLVILIVFVVQP